MGGQIDLDIVVSGLEEMYRALDNFARKAQELSATLSAHARVLSGESPDTYVQEFRTGLEPPWRTGHEPCPRLSALVSHDTHNWGPVGGICPGA